VGKTGLKLLWGTHADNCAEQVAEAWGDSSRSRSWAR